MGEIRKQVTSAAWSLPNWTDLPPEPDVTGAAFLLAGYGDADTNSVLDRWREVLRKFGAEDRVQVHRDTQFDRWSFYPALEQSRCGVRLMIAGPQYDVLTAMATARECGLESGEITGFATSVEDLPLFCPHCQWISRAYAEPFGTHICSGCQRELMIRPHFSSQRGSFLGVDAQAKEISEPAAMGAEI